MSTLLRIAIVGGGPSGLFIFKQLIESGRTDFYITVFERKKSLGSGMPYSTDGANDEHITNISGNEIPALVTQMNDWVRTLPQNTLDKFQINTDHFNEYKVLPRLLFGHYLDAQFSLLQQRAREKGIGFDIRYNSTVTDIIDLPEQGVALVEVQEQKTEFKRVIICTGHNWPKLYEGKVRGWFDSPYPPFKLAQMFNHPVAIKGSSLTAVDAIRTLARHNGTFKKDESGKLYYELLEQSIQMKLVLHTRNGMLPAVRFHLEDPHLSNGALLTGEEIKAHIATNSGFLSLDYIFEHDFKQPIGDKEPDFYVQIKDMNLEEFVAEMMQRREELDPFRLLKIEYDEAERSIRQKRSVYWKEMLGVLSFALNYPAKYLSAEDWLRLKKTLMPLISIVIAYIPQSSSEELLALHEAGVLDLIPVGADSKIEPGKNGGAVYHYIDETHQAQQVPFETYIDCAGQPHLAFDKLPFPSLLSKHTVSPAKLKFRSAYEGKKTLETGEGVSVDNCGDYYLQVPGITINDHFQVIDNSGTLNERLFMIAVPYIGGYNPDYSGLDFSETASHLVMQRLLC